MSCLFNSLAAKLKVGDGEALRQSICDYLSRDPPVMDDGTLFSMLVESYEHGSTVAEYVAKMRLKTTMGGGPEIKAFCNVHRMNVLVVHTKTKAEILFTSSPDNELVVIFYNGSHYEPKPF